MSTARAWFTVALHGCRDHGDDMGGPVLTCRRCLDDWPCEPYERAKRVLLYAATAARRDLAPPWWARLISGRSL